MIPKPSRHTSHRFVKSLHRDGRGEKAGTPAKNKAADGRKHFHLALDPDDPVWKRALARFLVPRDLDASLERHKRLGTPLMRDAIMFTVGRISKPFHGSNYRLPGGEGHMEAAIDFATRGSVFNELWHDFAALQCLESVGASWINSQPTSVALGLTTFALNLGCVAVQRYNRVRAFKYVEERLERGDPLEPSYSNWLGIEGEEDTGPLPSNV